MSLLVLHHGTDDGLGALAESIAQHDVEVRHVEVDATAEPALDDATGVLVLGEMPTGGFPDAELALLRDAVAAEVPVFGIGGGAEALAVALGGEVVDRQSPEAAFVPVHRTAPGREDDVAAGWPDGTRALALHRREVVRMPDGADQLLVGSDGPSLWRHGSAWGTSLHLQVDVATLQAWLAEADGQDLVAAAGVDIEELLDQARRHEPFVRAAGVSLVIRWLDSQVTT